MIARLALVLAFILGFGASAVAAPPPASVYSPQPRYMSAGGSRFNLAQEAKLTSSAGVQYRMSRITVPLPAWPASNQRFLLVNYESSVGQMLSCGPGLVVDAVSVWYNGVEYPVSYKGNFGSYFVPDQSIVLMDPVVGLNPPANATEYLNIATHSIGATDTYCVSGFIALKEQSETSQGFSVQATAVAQVHTNTPTLADSVGIQLAPIGGMFATGYVPSPTTGPVVLDICDSIGDAKGYIRANAGARAAMGMLHIAMDDSASGRISEFNTCSIGNGFSSYYTPGYEGDVLFQVVQQLGNVPWNQYNNELAVNVFGTGYSAFQSQLVLLKNYMYARFGKMPWIQFTGTTEGTDPTTFGGVVANQTYLNANFGPDPASTRRQAITLIQGGTISDAYIDYTTGVTEDASVPDTAKWKSPNFSTTLNTAVTGNSSTSAILNACPALGLNMVFDTTGTPDNDVGKYQVITASGSPCTITMNWDQGHAPLTIPTSHAANVTVVGSYTTGDPAATSGIHPATAMHLLEATAIEGQKTKYFALPFN